MSFTTVENNISPPNNFLSWIDFYTFVKMRTSYISVIERCSIKGCNNDKSETLLCRYSFFGQNYYIISVCDDCKNLKSSKKIKLHKNTILIQVTYNNILFLGNTLKLKDYKCFRNKVASFDSPPSSQTSYLIRIYPDYRCVCCFPYIKFGWKKRYIKLNPLVGSKASTPRLSGENAMYGDKNRHVIRKESVVFKLEEIPMRYESSPNTTPRRSTPSIGEIACPDSILTKSVIPTVINRQPQFSDSSSGISPNPLPSSTPSLPDSNKKRTDSDENVNVNVVYPAEEAEEKQEKPNESVSVMFGYK